MPSTPCAGHRPRRWSVTLRPTATPSARCWASPAFCARRGPTSPAPGVMPPGSFQHPVTTPAVHGVAARLLADGAQPSEIARQLWGTRSYAFNTVLGAALSRLRLEADAAAGRGWAWTWTTTEDLATAGIALDE